MFCSFIINIAVCNIQCTKCLWLIQKNANPSEINYYISITVFCAKESVIYFTPSLKMLLLAIPRTASIYVKMKRVAPLQ